MFKVTSRILSGLQSQLPYSDVAQKWYSAKTVYQRPLDICIIRQKLIAEPSTCSSSNNGFQHPCVFKRLYPITKLGLFCSMYYRGVFCNVYKRC